MAITTFAELKTAVQNWSTRTDTAFVNRIPEFVRLGEQRIFWGADEPFKSEPVRTGDMETSTDITLTAGVGTLPTNFLEAERVYFDGNPNAPLRFESRRNFYTTTQQISGGDRPSIYTIEGNSIIVAAGVSGTLKMLYNARFDYLTNDTDTNALLTDAPGVYLNAALFEGWHYSRNTAQKAESLQSYIAAANGITKAHRNAIYSGQTLSARAETCE